MRTSPCFFRTRSDGQYAATFEITYSCNLKCQHCMSNTNINSFLGMNYEKICKIFDELKEIGTGSIYITGGEPLLYYAIDQVLEYAFKLGFEVRLASNGIEVPKHIEAIKKYVCEVSLSLDAIGNRYDEIRGNPNLFENLDNAISLLQSNNIPCVISTVVSAANCFDIESVVKYVKMRGLNQLSISVMVPIDENSRGISVSDYYSVVEAIKSIKKQYEDDTFSILDRRMNPVDRSSSKCYGGEKIVHIDPKGIVYPCSWCGKVDALSSYSMKWEPGNLLSCVEKIRSIQEVVELHLKKYSYPGCPAMAALKESDHQICNDPINQLLLTQNIIQPQ